MPEYKGFRADYFIVDEQFDLDTGLFSGGWVPTNYPDLIALADLMWPDNVKLVVFPYQEPWSPWPSHRSQRLIPAELARVVGSNKPKFDWS